MGQLGSEFRVPSSEFRVRSSQFAVRALAHSTFHISHSAFESAFRISPSRTVYLTEYRARVRGKIRTTAGIWPNAIGGPVRTSLAFLP